MTHGGGLWGHRLWMGWRQGGEHLIFYPAGQRPCAILLMLRWPLLKTEKKNHICLGLALIYNSNIFVGKQWCYRSAVAFSPAVGGLTGISSHKIQPNICVLGLAGLSVSLITEQRGFPFKNVTWSSTLSSTLFRFLLFCMSAHADSYICPNLILI